MADTRSMTYSPIEDSQTASTLSNLIYKNPAYTKRVDREFSKGGAPGIGYLAEGLPFNIEGLASAYALKYGQDATMKLIEALPNLSSKDLISVFNDVSGAASESDSMRDREMTTYKRNGMEYRAGNFVPK